MVTKRKVVASPEKVVDASDNASKEIETILEDNAAIKKDETIIEEDNAGDEDDMEAAASRLPSLRPFTRGFIRGNFHGRNPF